MEYMAAELLELSGNMARDTQTKVVEAHYVLQQFAYDDELAVIFPDYARLGKALIEIPLPRASARESKRTIGEIWIGEADEESEEGEDIDVGEEEPAAKKQKGAPKGSVQLCKKCGLPRKGHTCTAK
jgi:hypothetical protein